MGVIERGKGWEMHLGDCLEVMSALEKADHVITDPPYDERTHAGARASAGAPAGIAFDSLGSPAALAQVLLTAASRWVLASPQLTGDRPGQACDAVAIMHARRASGRMRWNGRGTAAIWRYAVPRGDGRPDHPTPKPVPLMLALVADFTDPGETILDPFAGSSGTTGVACLRLGRQFVGIEKDPTYFALACERLRAEEQGSTLQAARAGQMALLGGGK